MGTVYTSFQENNEKRRELKNRNLSDQGRNFDLTEEIMELSSTSIDLGSARI